jgi:uronate dehydrogenase
MSPQKTILLTGAAGHIGTAIRPQLLEKYGRVRLFDLMAITDQQPGEEVVVGDIRSLASLRSAMDRVSCVVHLAGIAQEDAWPVIRDVNIEGTYNVLEAARMAGVPRVIFASSHHAVGFTTLGDYVPIDSELRPTGIYGVSKIFGEALGRLYALKFKMSVICLRIAAFQPQPHDHRQLLLWISHRDMAQLTIRSIDAADISFLTVFGVSGNARNPYDRAGWEKLGYVPQDDAERFLGTAPDLMGRATLPSDRFHGGDVCLEGLVEG